MKTTVTRINKYDVALTAEDIIALKKAKEIFESFINDDEDFSDDWDDCNMSITPEMFDSISDIQSIIENCDNLSYSFKDMIGRTC